MEAELIAETNYLHALWVLGPPPYYYLPTPYLYPQPPCFYLSPPYLQPQPPYHHPQPPYRHPQPPYHYPQPGYHHTHPHYQPAMYYHPEPPYHRPYPPTTSVYTVPASNISTSSSEASAKLLQLPPPEIKREEDAIILSPGEECVKGKENAGEGTTDSSCKGDTSLVEKCSSHKETANKGDINGSSDVTVPCQGEACEEKSKADEIVIEGHKEGPIHVTEVYEEKGKAEENAGEGTSDSSCKGSTLLVKMCPSCEERVHKGGIIVSRDVPFQEVCKEKGEAEETVNEGHIEGSIHVTEVSEKKGKAESIVNEVNMEGFVPITIIFEEDIANEETVNDGDTKGSMDVTVLAQGDVCEEEGKAEEIMYDEDKDEPMNVTVSFQHVAKGEEVIVNGGDKEGSVDVTVSCQGDTWKANEIVNEGDKESSMDVSASCQGHTREAEEIVNEGDKGGSTKVTAPCQGETLCNAGNGRSKYIGVGKVSDKWRSRYYDPKTKEQIYLGSYETEETAAAAAAAYDKAAVRFKCPIALLNFPERHSKDKSKTKEDVSAGINGGTSNGGRWLLKQCSGNSSGPALSEETINDGDTKGSMDVIVLAQGDVCEEKGKAEEIVHDEDKDEPMNVTVSCQHVAKWEEVIVNGGDKEGSVDVTVSCQGDAWKAKEIVNEGDKESSIDVTASCQGHTREAEEIVNEGDKEGSAKVTVPFQDEPLCSAGKGRSKFMGVGKVLNKWRSRYYDPKTKRQFFLGSYETEEAAAAAYDEAALRFKGPTALLNFPERHSKGKGNTKEVVGAGINGSTSNGSRWLLKQCLENSCGPALSKPQFVLYDLHNGSRLRQIPILNPADTQALEQSSHLAEGSEGIKNLLWGNTFFFSKRAAKLLGPILAGGFQYTPSFPDKPASQPTLPAKRPPHPRTRKPKAES